VAPPQSAAKVSPENKIAINMENNSENCTIFRLMLGFLSPIRIACSPGIIKERIFKYFVFWLRRRVLKIDYEFNKKKKMRIVGF